MWTDQDTLNLHFNGLSIEPTDLQVCLDSLTSGLVRCPSLHNGQVHYCSRVLHCKYLWAWRNGYVSGVTSISLRSLPSLPFTLLTSLCSTMFTSHTISSQRISVHSVSNWSRIGFPIDMHWWTSCTHLTWKNCTCNTLRFLRLSAFNWTSTDYTDEKVGRIHLRTCVANTEVSEIMIKRTCAREVC